MLDEPTSALDAKTEKAVMTTLRNLRDTVSIVLITHNLEIIKNAIKFSFCLRVVLWILAIIMN